MQLAETWCRLAAAFQTFHPPFFGFSLLVSLRARLQKPHFLGFAAIALTLLLLVQLEGVHPMVTVDDCLDAEDICKADEKFRAVVKERYGITDLDLVACDPWYYGDRYYYGKMMMIPLSNTPISFLRAIQNTAVPGSFKFSIPVDLTSAKDCIRHGHHSPLTHILPISTLDFFPPSCLGFSCCRGSPPVLCNVRRLLLSAMYSEQ